MLLKNLIATVYLKNGLPVKGFHDLESNGAQLESLVRSYNDKGADKIFVFDLSDDDEGHEQNLHAMKSINRISEVPVYAGGNINRLEDIKKIIYTGCKKAIVHGGKQNAIELIKEGALRFSADKIAVSFEHAENFGDFTEEDLENVSELVIFSKDLLPVSCAAGKKPCSFYSEQTDMEYLKSILLAECAPYGVASAKFGNPETDLLGIKKALLSYGIHTGHLQSAMEWEELSPNADGLIPVIVQDYKSDEVLMLAYMDREAYYTTLSIGKMTYYSRSRKELWTKGVTSGHFQYVKSLHIDCDCDTVLAKVSQVGAACHTGNPTCFYRDLVEETYPEKNPSQVLLEEFRVIEDRKANPKEGSYTNYLFDKGIDKILKKVGEEATEIVIAAKNPDPEEIKYEIADFLYHVMVLMAEKGITWEEVMEELSQR